jgi:shikimate dehydrogenase
LTAFNADGIPALTHQPTRLVLLGHPVGHSLSPLFQNAALEAAKIDLTYEPLDVEAAALRKVLSELKNSGGAGNVTIPHKGAVSEACDKLTDVAREVRAVNTFWVESGQLIGDNTDVAGFDRAARDLIGNEIEGARVTILGAGGAAAAVLAALRGWPGAYATVYSRNVARANSLALRFEDVARHETTAALALRSATLVVNATPVGQHDNVLPVEMSLVPRSADIIDLVYRKGGTAWVNAALTKGMRAADGLTMLLEQGALSFRRWFGIEPDRSAMLRAVS